MKRLLAVLLFTPLFTFAAEPLTHENKDKDTGRRLLLTIYDKPCESDGARAAFPSFVQAHLRAAVLLWQDKQYTSCYVVVDGMVWSADETGDPLTPIPLTAFVSRMI